MDYPEKSKLTCPVCGRESGHTENCPAQPKDVAVFRAREKGRAEYEWTPEEQAEIENIAKRFKQVIPIIAGYLIYFDVAGAREKVAAVSQYIFGDMQQPPQPEHRVPYYTYMMRKIFGHRIGHFLRSSVGLENLRSAYYWDKTKDVTLSEKALLRPVTDFYQLGFDLLDGDNSLEKLRGKELLLDFSVYPPYEFAEFWNNLIGGRYPDAPSVDTFVPKPWGALKAGSNDERINPIAYPEIVGKNHFIAALEKFNEYGIRLTTDTPWERVFSEALDAFAKPYEQLDLQKILRESITQLRTLKETPPEIRFVASEAAAPDTWEIVSKSGPLKEIFFEALKNATDSIEMRAYIINVLRNDFGAYEGSDSCPKDIYTRMVDRIIQALCDPRGPIRQTQEGMSKRLCGSGWLTTAVGPYDPKKKFPDYIRQEERAWYIPEIIVNHFINGESKVWQPRIEILVQQDERYQDVFMVTIVDNGLGYVGSANDERFRDEGYTTKAHGTGRGISSMEQMLRALALSWPRDLVELNSSGPFKGATLEIRISKQPKPVSIKQE